MMEWDTFVEYNKMMLMFTGAIFVGSVISSFIWLKYSECKVKVKDKL